MKLNQMFDSVIMLTASNWHTEPRSNRYHYATRFAKHVPVYFVQFEYDDRDKVTIEPSGVDNIFIVKASWWHAPQHTMDRAPKESFAPIQTFFDDLNCRRPLVWTYNPYAETRGAALHAAFRVYHATENYLLDEDDFRIGSLDPKAQEILVDRTKALLAGADLTVAVSDGVRESLMGANVATGPIIEVVNGCDAEFWLSQEAYEFAGKNDGTPTVLFQGGINRRLDFELIHDVILKMPDWDFWFCGMEDTSIAAWNMIKKHPNVTYHGALESEQIADLASKATVGWVPFVDTKVLRTSFPLKMFEYVACGLPVVSTPINGLLHHSKNLFRFAEDGDTFEKHIRDVAETRTDKKIIEERKRQARLNGYDERFKSVINAMLTCFGQLSPKKNILICYDEKYQYVNTINEHVKSFQKYSKNNIFYVPAVIASGNMDLQELFNGDEALDLNEGPNGIWDFDKFDVIIVHYSVRLTYENYILRSMAERIRKSKAYKILFIQDEYEHTNCAKDHMKRLAIDAVYTCVPEKGRERVYPKSEFPDVEFVQTLTGYIPENSSIEEDAMPLDQRETMIGYRGRILQHQYGQLGYEKYIIGERMREEAEKRDLKVNISSRAEDRIYGSWYGFLGSCRATLGSESGANIFDFDGSLQELAVKLADKTHEEVYEKHFEKYDNLVQMNQISPKFFEAIRLRTALICFRGYYSDILHPDVHYIPLEKDFSNVEEVFEKLQDDKYIKKLTDRAYKDVIESGRYTYKAFVRDFDDWLDERVPVSTRELISTPIAIRTAKGIIPIVGDDPRDKIINTAVLDHNSLRSDFKDLFVKSEEEVQLPPPSDGPANDQPVEVAVAVPTQKILLTQSARDQLAQRQQNTWFSMGFRTWVKSKLVRASLIQASGNRPWYFGFLELGWRFVPGPAKRFVGRSFL